MTLMYDDSNGKCITRLATSVDVVGVIASRFSVVPYCFVGNLGQDFTIDTGRVIHALASTPCRVAVFVGPLGERFESHLDDLFVASQLDRETDDKLLTLSLSGSLDSALQVAMGLAECPREILVVDTARIPN
jgi:hypothetical protein